MPPSTTVGLPPQLVRQLRTFRRRLRTVKMLEAVCLCRHCRHSFLRAPVPFRQIVGDASRRRLAPVFHRRVRPGGVYSLVEFPVGVAEAHGSPAGAADFPDGRGPGGSSSGRHRTGFGEERGRRIRFRKAERGGHGAGGPPGVARPGCDSEHPPAQPPGSCASCWRFSPHAPAAVCAVSPEAAGNALKRWGPPVQSSGTLYTFTQLAPARIPWSFPWERAACMKSGWRREPKPARRRQSIFSATG